MTEGLVGFHITWVTHNSRVSERMVTYGVKAGAPRLFSPGERNLVQSFLVEKIDQLGLKVIALNVMEDHVHTILVCREEDRDKIVGQLKGYSASKLNRNIDAPASPNPVNRGVYPSEDTDAAIEKAVYADGTRKKVWGKGYSHTYLFSDEQLANAVEYVELNHLKHNILPLEKQFSNWTGNSSFNDETSVATSIKDAFNH